MTGIVNKFSTHPEENKGACIIVLRKSERAGYKKPANGWRGVKLVKEIEE